MIKKNVISLCVIIGFTISMHQNSFAQGKAQNHFLDIGAGFGLDYGGLIGVKVDYILPFPYVSFFGSAGAQMLGLGWNVGTTIHFLPENSKTSIRPNLKLMYGINRTTVIVGASEYDKMFTGFTPGAGVEFMFGKKKANGFDVDLNVPIGSTAFNDQVTAIKADSRVTTFSYLPVAFSIGYHHEF